MIDKAQGIVSRGAVVRALIAAGGLALILQSGTPCPAEAAIVRTSLIRQIQGQARADSIPVTTTAGATAPRLLAPGLELRPGEAIRLTRPPRDSTAGGVHYRLLPSTYVTTTMNDRVVHVGPVLAVEGGGLWFDADQERFVGRARLGLQDLEHPGQATRVLPNHVFISAAGCQVRPAHMEFRRTERYDSLEIVSVDPASEVRLVLQFTAPPDTLEHALAVDRPVIEGSIKDNLPGLGMGWAQVTVTLPQSAGPTERVVTLTPKNGWVEKDTVRIVGRQTRMVTFRTRGLADDQIELASSPLAAVSLPVDVSLPVSILVAVALGVVAGGWAGGRIRARGKPKSAPSASQAKIAPWVADAIIGVGVTALYVLGVNVTPISLPILFNEVALFAVAMLGALGAEVWLRTAIWKESDT